MPLHTMNGYLVRVCQEQRDRLMALAQAHEDRANERGATNQLADREGYSQLDGRYFGYIAEYAVAEFYGCQFDWSVYAYGDDGIDLFLADGKTVQVKSTRYPSGNMTSPASRRIVADFVVSTIVSLPDEVEIVGWCTRDLWYERVEYIDYGKNGRTQTLRAGHLAPPETLSAVNLEANHLTFVAPPVQQSPYRGLVCRA